MSQIIPARPGSYVVRANTDAPRLEVLSFELYPVEAWLVDPDEEQGLPMVIDENLGRLEVRDTASLVHSHLLRSEETGHALLEDLLAKLEHLVAAARKAERESRPVEMREDRDLVHRDTAPDPINVVTHRRGDPDPTAGYQGVTCTYTDRDLRGEWQCTRRRCHIGQHLAGDGRIVQHVWS